MYLELLQHEDSLQNETHLQHVSHENQTNRQILFVVNVAKIMMM